MWGKIYPRTINAIHLLLESQIRIWIHMTKERVNCINGASLAETVMHTWI